MEAPIGTAARQSYKKDPEENGRSSSATALVHLAPSLYIMSKEVLLLCSLSFQLLLCDSLAEYIHTRSSTHLQRHYK